MKYLLRIGFYTVFVLFCATSAFTRVTYKDLLKNLPKKQHMLFKGSKYLVGSLVVEITVERETKNLLKINSNQEAYVVGVKVLQHVFDTTLSLRDFKPVQTFYTEVKKSKMRFNFFFKDYYRYLRITKFKNLIEIDNNGNIISPKGFDTKKHDIKNTTHPFPIKNSIIFDPNTILLSLPYVDVAMLSKLDKMKLIFTTMDHVFPFKLKIEKETPDYRYIRIDYQSNEAEKSGLVFKKIVIDKKKKALIRVTGAEKHVGVVEISLRELNRSKD